MALALFDLDNTLIAGDSDHAWGEFLVANGYVDGEQFQATNDQFYEDYKRGELDIIAYLTFALEPLTRFAPEELEAMRTRFITEVIEPMWLPKAEALVEKHREAGDHLLIITATNRFVTEKIAEKFNVDTLLASEPEVIDGRYTGKPTGVPCYHAGKVTRLNAWLEENSMSLEGSIFYSDSHNDIPLLEIVETPVVVDGDPQLLEMARERHWEVMSLR